MEDHMKKRFFITLICLSLIMFSACTDNSKEPIVSGDHGTSTYPFTSINEPVSMEEDPYNLEISSTDLESYDEQGRQELESQKSILGRASNKPYSKLITQTYSEKKLFEDGIVYTFLDLQAGLFTYFISSSSDKYPIECLRKTSDNSVYVIYKTDEGGFAYRFFEKGVYGNDFFLIKHNIYVKKKISHSEFKKVKVGNSIKKVEEIDPVTELYKNDVQEFHDTFATIHLLTDGVMVFHFEKSGNDYKVKAIEYFDDYIISLYDGEVTYDCRIRPEDFLS